MSQRLRYWCAHIAMTSLQGVILGFVTVNMIVEITPGALQKEDGNGKLVAMVHGYVSK